MSDKVAMTLDGTEVLEKQWTDWRWQLKHSITDISMFEKLLGVRFESAERIQIEQTLGKFPLSITPYYLSLINRNNYRNDPVFKQSFPTPSELIIQSHEMSDPLAEDRDSPVPGLTHRYPDRVLLHVSNVCSMYCRHCTRKRKVGDVDSIPDKDCIKQGIDYIREHPQIRTCCCRRRPVHAADEFLDWILTEVRKIRL